MIGILLGIAEWIFGLFLHPRASPEAQAAASAAAARVTAKVDVSAAIAQAAEAQAVVNAPTTQADVAAALDKGAF